MEITNVKVTTDNSASTSKNWKLNCHAIHFYLSEVYHRRTPSQAIIEIPHICVRYSTLSKDQVMEPAREAWQTDIMEDYSKSAVNKEKIMTLVENGLN